MANKSIFIDSTSEYSSIDYGRLGHDKKSVNDASKTKSHEYYNKNPIKLHRDWRMYVRGVSRVSREDFPQVSRSQLANHLKKKYLKKNNYVNLDDIVLVDSAFFKQLLSMEKSVNQTLDNMVYETALDRKNDKLIYDLGTVVEKLNFDSDDVKDILNLLEDDDFETTSEEDD